MSTILEIEDAIQQLPPEELAKFREWFAQYDGARWDQQIENDIAAGRLSGLAKEALDDLNHGRCRDL